MKVLNIMSRFNVGGTAQWLNQLSVGLDKNDIENELLVGNCSLDEIEDERLHSLTHKKILGLGPGTSIQNTIKAFFEIRKEINAYRPDIVNTHTSKAGVIGRIAAVSIRPRPKIVHTYHGHVFSGYFNPFIAAAIKLIERSLAHVTDYFFTLGERVFNDLRALKIVNQDNYFQVLPGVEDVLKIEKTQARKNLGIESDSVVVGWLGRKVPIKRLDRILDLAQKNQDLVFLIAGVGPSVKTTFKSRFANGSLSNVIEIDYATPSEIWSASDICLLTSDNEGIPTSAVEAALFSLPVVSTDAGSISDVVKNGVTGYICKSEIDSISKVLRELANSPKLRISMGEQARNLALEKFSPASFIKSHTFGYEKALHG